MNRTMSRLWPRKMALRRMQQQRQVAMTLVLLLPCFQMIEWNLSIHRIMLLHVAPPGHQPPSPETNVVGFQSTMMEMLDYLWTDHGTTLHSRALTMEEKPSQEMNLPILPPPPPPPPPPRARVLLGIFSHETALAARDEYRARLESWQGLDRRYKNAICSWTEFRDDDSGQCELIYTFVIGGANETDAPTENVGGNRTMLVNRSTFESVDTIWLNVRENTDEGKAQTWLKYSTELAEKHDIDYVAKCEQDSFLHIQKYFEFSDQRLRPAPYNQAVFAGALRDKTLWKKFPRGNVKEVWRTEKLFRISFHGKCRLLELPR
jgi:hypothetical protein